MVCVRAVKRTMDGPLPLAGIFLFRERRHIEIVSFIVHFVFRLVVLVAVFFQGK